MELGRAIGEVRNPEGRVVRLERTVWEHVLDEHPELTDFLADIMSAIANPDHREPDPRAGRERYFACAGPLNWIRVVTEFSGGFDRVVTAFPQSNDPRRRGWGQ